MTDDNRHRGNAQNENRLSFSFTVAQCVVFLPILAAIGIMAFITYLPSALTFDRTVSSIRKYDACRDSFPSHLVDHFPGAKPKPSAQALFNYYPGYLQAGSHIQLRVKVTPAIALATDAKLRIQTAHNYSGGNTFTHFNNDRQNAWPTTELYTQRNDQTKSEFPNHFTLHVLHAHTDHGWNHGETKGIAVSLKTNELIYWAKQW